MDDLVLLDVTDDLEIAPIAASKADLRECDPGAHGRAARRGATGPAQAASTSTPAAASSGARRRCVEAPSGVVRPATQPAAQVEARDDQRRGVVGRAQHSPAYSLSRYARLHLRSGRGALWRLSGTSPLDVGPPSPQPHVVGEILQLTLDKEHALVTAW